MPRHPEATADPIWGRRPLGSENEQAHSPGLMFDEPAEREEDIPPREYIVPDFLQRGTLIELVGPGGVGKGQLLSAWAVALALGRPFGCFRPERPAKVLVFNAEDDIAEQQRRAAAALRFYGMSKRDLGGRLVLSTPSRLGTLFTFDESGARIEGTELLDEVRQLIHRIKPDVVILDPFAELHNMPENDNSGIRAVGAELRELARTAAGTGTAVVLVHHTRKGGPDPGNMDVSRGASSLGALVRKALTVFPMTQAEAETWRIAKPAYYFRLDGAKANNDAKNATEWFERVPVSLDNGDTVARCEPWTPPADQIKDEMMETLLGLVAVGEGGQPWTRRLGHYDRSIAKAMERVGIGTRAGQREALERLFAAGVEEAYWRRPNRAKAQGLRHPNGKPHVSWGD